MCPKCYSTNHGTAESGWSGSLVVAVNICRENYEGISGTQHLGITYMTTSKNETDSRPAPLSAAQNPTNTASPLSRSKQDAAATRGPPARPRAYIRRRAGRCTKPVEATD